MKILVTGGAGYIGSATTQILLEAGHTVVVYDNLCHGYRAAVPTSATFIQGDLHDRAALDAAFEKHKPEAVMHFAAFIEAGESMRDPGKFFHNNVAGSLNLIEATAVHDVRRFVFSSTAAVYAASDSPLTEASRIEPANCYGETKLMIERMLAWYHRIYGLRYAALRYFNASGGAPDRGEAHRPESHLIPLVLQVALGQRERASICPRARRAGKPRDDDLQPGQRRGLFRARGDRGRAPGDRAADPRSGNAASSWRCAAPGRQLRSDPP